MNNIEKASKKRFFMALIPPEDVQKEATKITVTQSSRL